MKRKSGTTLIELLVYMGLFSLALATIYAFFHFGNRWLHKTRTLVEVQAQTNVATSWLMKDLMEAPEDFITSYPNGTSPNVPAGVVFLSARDPNTDQMVYNPDTGDPRWQTYVGYYLAADPERPTDTRVMALFRGEVGQPTGGLPTQNPLTPQAAGVTTDTIRTSGNPRVIAHGLVPASGTDHGGLDVYWNQSALPAFTKGYANTGSPTYIDVLLRNTTRGSEETELRTMLRIQNRGG